MSTLDKYLSNKHFWAFALGSILIICLILEFSGSKSKKVSKNTLYYNNSQPTSKHIISDRLKDPNTLEQEMVNHMISSSKIDYPSNTARYQPLLPNLETSTLVN